MEGIFQLEIQEVIEKLKLLGGSPEFTSKLFNIAIFNVLWMIVAGERFEQDDIDARILMHHVQSYVDHVILYIGIAEDLNLSNWKLSYADTVNVHSKQKSYDSWVRLSQ